MAFVKKHRADLLLILALLLLAGAAWLYMSLTREPGGEAVVTIDGEERARLPLDEDGQWVFESARGENTLVIENGEAYISQASCPDHICVHQGRVSFDGETIVCLPNRLIVTIEGGKSAETDASAG